MDKYIPYEKLSRKKNRKQNPVTRKPENSKAYNRRRTQDWKKELPDSAPFYCAASTILTFHLAVL